MYERATSVMGGPPLSVFFFFFSPLPPRMDRGARGRKHLVSKKKKTTEEGAGLEGERREEEEGVYGTRSGTDSPATERAREVEVRREKSEYGGGMDARKRGRKKKKLKYRS